MNQPLEETDRTTPFEELRSTFEPRSEVLAGYVFGSAATGEWREGYSDFDFGIFWESVEAIDFEAQQVFLDTLSATSPSTRIDLFAYTPHDLPFGSRFFQIRFLSEARHLFGRPFHEDLSFPVRSEIEPESRMLLERHAVLSRATLLEARRVGPQRAANACYKVLIEAFRLASTAAGGLDTSKRSATAHVLPVLTPAQRTVVEDLRSWHGKTSVPSSASQVDGAIGHVIRIMERLRETCGSLTPEADIDW